MDREKQKKMEKERMEKQRAEMETDEKADADDADEDGGDGPRVPRKSKFVSVTSRFFFPKLHLISIFLISLPGRSEDFQKSPVT